MYVDILEIEKEHLKLVQISFWQRVIDMDLVQAIQPRSQGREAMRLARQLPYVKNNSE